MPIPEQLKSQPPALERRHTTFNGEKGTIVWTTLPKTEFPYKSQRTIRAKLFISDGFPSLPPGQQIYLGPRAAW